MIANIRTLGSRFQQIVLAQSQIVEPQLDLHTLRVVDSRTFLSQNFQQSWLVRKLFVAGQPAIVGGSKKVLKTTLLLDLTVSLATGNNFLGYFQVQEPVRVGMLSGESGGFTINETVRRICASKGIRDPLSLNVYWGERLPSLTNPTDLRTLHSICVDNDLKVLILDPLYLCLLAGNHDFQASNLYQIGPLLSDVAQACLEAGATPILAHHTKKGTTNGYQPPELEDLAFAGVQEFARQWLLMGRRQAYEPGSGQHKLWLNVGGSAGHSGCWAMDVEEGQLQDDFSGRQWHVTVRTATEERGRVAGERAEAEDARAEETYRQNYRRVVDALQDFPQGETMTGIAAACGLSKPTTAATLRRIMGECLVVSECMVRKPAGTSGSRLYPGFILTSFLDDTESCTPPGCNGRE